MSSTGIKLTINDKVYKAYLEHGSIHAITIGYENEVDLYLTGYNVGQKVTWHKSALGRGAAFSLEVVEMEESSNPQEMKEYTNEELLHRYALLKQKLSSEG
ncbi:MAG: hypothetical protein LBF67_04045 [Prevotellaceae bacterium]|jgi:hypothetical protein|nr:hypothetical protein [Prevotellaceae bacterium]